MIDRGEIKEVFENMTIPSTKKHTKTISLLEILKQAYEEENADSKEFIETLRGAVRMYFQEMCDEGLIHQSTIKNITGIGK